MATISSPGLGSGLDVKTIVSQLVAIERQPINVLAQQKATLQDKLSSFGLLQSYVVNIQDAAAALAKPGLWQQTTANSSDKAAVSATSSGTAVPANYSIEVGQLAQAQALASKSYESNTAPVGTGTLRIELGGWTAGGPPFVPKSPPSQVDIPIGVGEDSLESVRAKINASNAGVSASIIRDSAGARLVIRSTGTGLENSMRIMAVPADAPTEPGGPTLNDLVFDNPAGSATMTQSLAPLDATAVVNGLPVTSPSNTLRNVIEGVTLTLSQTTAKPVQLTVGVDSDAMKKAMNDFAKAYSDINKYINDQTKYDPDKKVASPLQGDRATLSLQSQLRSMLGANGNASKVFSRMSDAGLELQADGALKLNDSKFSAAMGNLPELARAFSNNNVDNPGDNGFAVRIKQLTTQMTDSQGTVNTRSQGLRDSITRNEKQAARLEDRVLATQARLERQYGALDTSLTKLSGLNSFVTQQIAAWNRSGN
ncbi:MAG: flagellar filament capping protein FliD [Rhizobacter sp.]|nr:flagellar filament capping protein FliD [Rhizobacter sp.]